MLLYICKRVSFFVVNIKNYENKIPCLNAAGLYKPVCATKLHRNQ
jgi:hypothetical protein